MLETEGKAGSHNTAACQHFSLDDDSEDSEGIASAGHDMANGEPDMGEGSDVFPGAALFGPTLSEKAGDAEPVRWLESRSPTKHARPVEAISVDHAAWLREVYTAHKPDNVPQVSTILERYRGREEDLVAIICEKYGISPPGVPNSLSAIDGSSCMSEDANEPDYPELIRGVYEQVNPDKIGDIPSLLSKYAGKERALYLRICEKYKVTPHQAAAAAEAQALAPPDPPALAQTTQAPQRMPLVRFSIIPTRKQFFSRSAPQKTEPADELQRQLQEALAEVIRVQKERDEAFEGMTEIQEILGEANWRSCIAQQEVSELEAKVALSKGEPWLAEMEEWRKLYTQELETAEAAKAAAAESEQESERLRFRLKELSHEQNGAIDGMHAKASLGQEALELRLEVERLQGLNADLMRRTEEDAKASRDEIVSLKSELKQLQASFENYDGSALSSELQQLQELHAMETQSAKDALVAAQAKSEEAERLADERDAYQRDVDRLQREIASTRRDAEDAQAQAERSEALSVDEARHASELSQVAQHQIVSLTSELEELQKVAADTSSALAESQQQALDLREELRQAEFARPESEQLPLHANSTLAAQQILDPPETPATSDAVDASSGSADGNDDLHSER